MKADKKADKIDINQIMYTTRKEYLTQILTLTEASEELEISDGYLRQLVIKGEFESWEFKKVGRVTIFLKESIERRKTKFKKW